MVITDWLTGEQVEFSDDDFESPAFDSNEEVMSGCPAYCSQLGKCTYGKGCILDEGVENYG